jgi:CRISPR-associated protein Cas2
MRRLRYLVAYDIADPRRWRKVYQLLLNAGDPVQFSVFVCDLTVPELAALRRALERVMVVGEDRFLIARLGDPAAEGVIEFLGDKPTLPTAGTAIF